jgi:hypothetical protein
MLPIIANRVFRLLLGSIDGSKSKKPITGQEATPHQDPEA